LRARLGINPGQRIVLSPRILQPLYRIHLLVEAMPLIVRDIPDAVLLVTEHRPDPDYRAQIVRRVHELGLGKHVIFCGDIGHHEMPLLYSAAEISIGIPSSDGLPQSLLEAMACETPSILSRLPRYEEIVRHEHSAYFVDATPEAIAAGVIRLLRDPDLRARISRNALEIVAREGNLDDAASRVLQRYRQLISSVPAQVFSVSRCWCAWRSFRRFRAARTA
jgi:glycosyltransferase involved in cell wall biosynthesis